MLESLIDANEKFEEVNKLLKEVLRDDDIPIIIRADILNRLDNLGKTLCIKEGFLTQILGDKYSVQDVVEAISTTTDKFMEGWYYLLLEQLVANGIRVVIKIH